MALPQQEKRNSLWDFFFGRPERQEQITDYNPEQIAALDEMLRQGREGLEGGNVNLGPLEQQAQRNFQTNTIPSIAERFTSMGSGNRLGSGNFIGQLGAAGAGLNLDLNKMRYDQLNKLLSGGLTPQYSNLFREREPGIFESTYNKGAQFAGNVAGGFAGAPRAGTDAFSSQQPQPKYNFGGGQQRNEYAGGGYGADPMEKAQWAKMFGGF